MSSSPATEQASASKPERPVFVHVMLGVLAVLFLTMMGLIYMQWVRRPLNAAVFVRGNSHIAGARVQVDSPSGPVSQAVTLSAQNEYQCLLYVVLRGDPYWLEITYQGHTEQLKLGNLRPGEQLLIEPRTQPATEPAHAL